MNVRPDQLAKVLTKQVYPLYFVCGDEPLQQMEVSDDIRRFLRNEQYNERITMDIDASFDWQGFVEETASMSLFAERRILELRMPTAKPGRQGAQVLKDYCQRPADDTVVLITAGKLEASAKKSAWFKAIEKTGMVIQCWPVNSEQLPSWVQQRFMRHDMQPDKDVVSYVSQQIEGNLLAAAQEIEKLYLLIGPGKVSYADVSQVITQQSRFSLFELTDVMLKGDQARVVRIIDGLKAEGTEPVIINWALAKDIRLLCQAAANPSSADYMLSRSGVWKNRLALFQACLSRHSLRFFQAMLKRCALIDRASKGVSQADVWDEMMGLSFRVAGHSRRS